MGIGIKHSKFRPALTVLATLVATGSMLMAPAAVHAAKALPELLPGSATCEGDASSATFGMDDAGKGRWVHVSTWIVVNGDTSTLPTGLDAAKVERSPDTVIDTSAKGGIVAGDRVAWQAALVDRKGNELSPRVATDTTACQPAGGFGG